MQNKIIKQYYALSFMFSAGGMSIISAIYVTYLIKHGLSLFEVNLVNTVFFVTLFICEIPTGAFADVCGRKASFVVACILMSLGMVIYGSSSTILGFILAEILSAIANTFRSGAFQAWLVDSLKHHGYEGDFARIFGRESLMNKIGGGFGAIVGSYLFHFKASFPWYFGGVILIICAVMAIVIMKEEYFIRGHLSWKTGFVSMKDTVISSIRYGINDKVVRFTLVITGFQIFSFQSLNMYWQPNFKDNGLDEQNLGYLFNGIMIAMAIGSYLATKFLIKNQERTVIVLLQLFIGLLVIATAMSANLPVMIILFLLHEVPRGCLGPYMDSYLHKRIPSNERATIVSFGSIAHHFGGAIGLVVSGLIAQTFGISTAWIVSGLFLIASALLMMKR